MVIANIILFLVACLFLVFSGTLLVKSLTKLATYLHVSEFVIGFIIMAFATSVPELFVGINAAIAQKTSLALGMIIGSNIANLTLVMGIAILLKGGISIESKKTKVDSLYMFAIAALPLVLMWVGGSISKIDGIILICAFLIYARKLYKERKVFTKELENHYKRWEPIVHTFLFIASLGLLFLASKYVIEYAGLLALDFALPPIMMGLFIIALGTSLPELVFEAKAVMLGHTEMALGNIIGSVIVNSTLVLGVTALIFPITAELLFFFTSGFFMLLVVFLFATFVESGDKLYIKEGISLIFLYVFFIIIEFYIKGIV